MNNPLRIDAYGVMLITMTKAPLAGDEMREMSRRRPLSILLVLILALPILAIPGVNALSDEGEGWALQAQAITASFESNGESTTISWRSIDDTNFAEDLWDATFHVYRHDQPMDPGVLFGMTPIASIDACDQIEVPNPLNCLGSKPDGSHSVIFQVPPGVNGSYFYAVTTELVNGTETMELTHNASHLYEPVLEVTTAVRSPYYIQGEFDPTASTTTLNWVNYNIISPGTLPVTGPDAYEIHIWQHAFRIDRSLGMMLMNEVPILTLPAETSSVEIEIPPSTNRQVYYSVTYVISNWTAPNSTYEDFRFLSNNSLDEPIKEDNVPAEAVTGPVMASNRVKAEFFGEENLQGNGYTLISWNDVPGEANEFYRVWMAGYAFNNTSRSDVQVIATIGENVGEFNYSLPPGRLGNGYYCVSIVDEYGITTSELKNTACAQPIFEDTFGLWIAEPTNVYAEYLGGGKTRVSWTDQVGAEGESYNIYRASYEVVVVDPNNPVQFIVDENMFFLANVPDGFGEIVVDVAEEVYRENSYYYVTSEARYGHLNGTYEYRGLKQNFYGPITEDTVSPQVPAMTELKMYGETDQVILTWLNDEEEFDEVYQIWRHSGDPFVDEVGELTFKTSITAENGWELVIDNIAVGISDDDTFIKTIDIAEGVERNVWYAVSITDRFGNTNFDAWSTPGKNAWQVREDATTSTATIFIENDDREIVDLTLQKGSYRLLINVSEDLEDEPMVNISTPDRVFTVGDGEQTHLLFDTPLDDTIGNTYYYDFEITGIDKHNVLTVVVTMTDSVGNGGNISVSDWEIDSQVPSIVFYSPGAPKDTTYMEGDSILISGGTDDDVGVNVIEIRFVTASSSGRWIDITDESTLSEDGWAFSYSVSVADFPYGIVRVEIRATDMAGNQNSAQVSFNTDSCHHTQNGTTRCLKEELLAPPPEAVFESMELSDGPFLFVFILLGINLFAILIAAITLFTSLSAPRKKGDEDAGDEWMSEFIGTSAQPDMDAIAGIKEEVSMADDTADDDEEDADDPFAVNVLQRKERRKKGTDLKQTVSGDVSVFEHDGDDDDDDGGKKKRRSIKRKK
jgi:hypothetical protein